MKRVLVPVDFSDGSHAAVLAADRMADVFGAELVVLHVAPHAAGSRGGEVDPAAAHLMVDGLFGQGELVSNLEDQMQIFLGRTEPPKHPRRVIFRAGSAAKVIVATAEELQASLVVMATHGRTGLARVVLGSTAEEVVRGAPCPVLTVKPETVFDLGVDAALTAMPKH